MSSEPCVGSLLMCSRVVGVSSILEVGKSAACLAGGSADGGGSLALRENSVRRAM